MIPRYWPRWHRRAIFGLAFGWLLSGEVHAQRAQSPPAVVRAIIPAKQIGVSCAFFANVPVLTRIGGIHIAGSTDESRKFVAAIYGLRHGDTRFVSAFDRGLFFELFGIPAQATRMDYPGNSRQEALAQAGALIREVVQPALENGEFLSIRARGPFGGPHNMLLVGYANGWFYLHDPTSGTIKGIREAGLATHLVSESKAKSKSGGSSLRRRFFTSFHRVHAGPHRPAIPLLLSQLPDSITVHLAETSRQALADALNASTDATPGTDAASVVTRFPAIDFAVVSRRTKGKPVLASAIGADVPAPGLVGAAHLARLTLTSYQIGARRLLPVWLIDGQPRVITGHSVPTPDAGDSGTVTWFDGNESTTLDLPEALRRLRASGALIGHVALPAE